MLTESAKNFITPLSVSSLLGKKVFDDLFCLDDEMEMGHIKLAKESDLILVAPASANFIAKIANGIADDLASTIMLATRSSSLIFPAMNTNMLNNFFTKKNLENLKMAGHKIYGTDNGELACGETGPGRMIEPEKIADIIKTHFLKEKKIFKGVNALITAGPTQEAIDPVRYISNYSSGKQGYAIAEELANMGANVCLISGPTNLKQPENIKKFIKVTTADQMFEKCSKNVPADLFISIAAVADWKVQSFSENKLKKSDKKISFKLTENKDILTYISNHNNRPKLVIGFAAETKNIKKNALLKINKKNCDLIVANDVSLKTNTMGGDKNSVHIFNKSSCLVKYKTMDKILLSRKILTEVVLPLLKKGQNSALNI